MLLATFCLLVLAVYIAACIGVEIITKDEVLRQNPNVSQCPGWSQGGRVEISQHRSASNNDFSKHTPGRHLVEFEHSKSVPCRI